MDDNNEPLRCANCEFKFPKNHLTYHCDKCEKYYCFNCFKKTHFETHGEEYHVYIVTEKGLVPLECADCENKFHENHLVYEYKEYYCFNCFKNNHFEKDDEEYQVHIVTKKKLVLRKCADCDNKFPENHLVYNCDKCEKYYCFNCFKNNHFETHGEEYQAHVVTKKELVSLDYEDLIDKIVRKTLITFNPPYSVLILD